MFFSEEKNQKTFMLRRCGTIPAMASIVEPAERQSLGDIVVAKPTYHA
jgi:hypothetical protein